MRFVIQQDRTTGDFEIVARRNKKRFVVQRNIKTYLKAKYAQKFWRELTGRSNGDAKLNA